MQTDKLCTVAAAFLRNDAGKHDKDSRDSPAAYHTVPHIRLALESGYVPRLAWKTPENLAVLVAPLDSPMLMTADTFLVCCAYNARTQRAPLISPLMPLVFVYATLVGTRVKCKGAVGIIAVFCWLSNDCGAATGLLF